MTFTTTYQGSRHAFQVLAAATMTLLATVAHAQPEAPAAVPAIQAAAAVPQPKQVSATAGAATKPRYSAEDIARAFSFMDSDKNGSISREEASGFRGVAKHFAEADTNKDTHLSHQEFESAMNQVKNR